jgi:hypothetical protein
MGRCSSNSSVKGIAVLPDGYCEGQQLLKRLVGGSESEGNAPGHQFDAVGQALQIPLIHSLQHLGRRFDKDRRGCGPAVVFFLELLPEALPPPLFIECNLPCRHPTQVLEQSGFVHNDGVPCGLGR